MFPQIIFRPNLALLAHKLNNSMLVSVKELFTRQPLAIKASIIQPRKAMSISKRKERRSPKYEQERD